MCNLLSPSVAASVKCFTKVRTTSVYETGTLYGKGQFCFPGLITFVRMMKMFITTDEPRITHVKRSQMEIRLKRIF